MLPDHLFPETHTFKKNMSAEVTKDQCISFSFRGI